MSKTGIVICTLLIATIAMLSRNWFKPDPPLMVSAVGAPRYYCEPDTERYSLIFLRSEQRPESIQERHVRTVIFPKMTTALKEAMPPSIKVEMSVETNLSCRGLVPTGEMRAPSAVILYVARRYGRQKGGYVRYFNVSDRWGSRLCNRDHPESLVQVHPDSAKSIVRIRDDLIETSAGGTELPGIVKWTGDQVRAFGSSCTSLAKEIRVINDTRFHYWWDLSEKQKKVVEPPA